MAGTELLEALCEAIYTTDAEGRITFYNQAAADLWGHRPELGSTQWCGSWRLYWPDGTPLPHDQCPMAVTLKEGRPVRGVEAIAERPDGTRIRFCPYPTPLHDKSGRLTGAINLLVDVTDRHRDELESERLSAIVSGSDDAIISKTLTGQITSWNAGATRIFGYQPVEMIGRPITTIIPADLWDEEKQILAKIQRGERIEHYETLRVAKDGRRVHISLSVSPLRDKTGKVVGASKIARDITGRKRAEEMQRLLMDELTHRVKNTLATVQAIATQSARRAKSPADFVASFSGRIQALARAHTLLLNNELRGADVGTIVRDQVLLGGADDDRISCSGPLLRLDSQTAMHLALVLHELGTNARKYGALSVSGGKLSIAWEMRTNGGRDLHLQWKESRGPKVSAPSAHGFGSILIEQTIRAYGGDVSLRYNEDGVSCEIRLPIPEVSRSLGGFVPGIMRPAADISPIDHAGSRSSLAGKRILIVEDEPLLAMEIEATLAEAGCQIVGVAASLDAAKRLIAECDCDAAVLDVNLSGRRVDDLAIALTQKNIPFAFVTGYGRDALPDGFRDAIKLDKPFSDSQLRAIVEVLVYQGAHIVPLRRNESAPTA